MSARAQRRRVSCHITRALHTDQAMWRLGMAAYWFDTFCMAPESKDHGPPLTSSVSTKPKGSMPCSASRRAPP